MSFFLAILTAMPAAHASPACPQTFTEADIIESARTTEGFFARVDAPGFAASRQAMEGRLVCTREILKVATIARVERVEALGAFFDRKDDHVREALAGLDVVSPGYLIPVELVPEGHPLRAQMAEAHTLAGDPATVPIPPPSAGWLMVDGVTGTTVPAKRASVVQQLDALGTVVATHFRWGEETGWGWMVQQKPARAASTGGTRRVALVGSGAAAVIGSVVLIGLAAGQRATFDGSGVMSADASAEAKATYKTQLEGMQGKAAGFDVGGYALGGVGVVLGAVAVFTW